MNIVNDDVLHTILVSKQCDCCSIRILDRCIDDNIVEAGNNYATLVSRLTIRYEMKNLCDEDREGTSPREKILFLKVPSSAPLYEFVKKLGTYDNEVEMYTQVLQQMYTIEEEYFTPKLYYHDNKMSLVLTDLSQSGYKCANRILQLDFEHCFHALRCLAKFHALSVKLERTSGLPKLVKMDHFMNLDKETQNSYLLQIPLFIDSLPQHLKHQYPDMVTHFRNLSSPETFMKLATDFSDDTFKTLNHGDFQTNNIMFKYDKFGTIKKIKLIDFQLTSWRSPVKDLIYFIITSMKFEVYEKYFPFLLKTYLDTLNRVLCQLDCPVYNMASLLDDLDDANDFGLLMLCWALPVIITDPEDPINTKEMCKDNAYDVNGVAKAYKQKYFQSIAPKWFEYFARKGTLRIDEKEI